MSSAPQPTPQNLAGGKSTAEQAPAPATTPAATQAAGAGSAGNGGITYGIGISSPKAGDAVVGVNPGIPVVVEGTTLVDPGNPTVYVAVSLGGPESPAMAIASNDSWSYQGTTSKGGPITIVATMYRDRAKTVELATNSVAVSVNNNPALSATIANPPDGSSIETWSNPTTTASGSATFNAVITSCQVQVTITNGGITTSGFAFLGPGTVSGAQLVYNWTYPCTFTQTDPKTTISVTALGNFTDSQGKTQTVSSQPPPSTHTINVQVDSTPPVLQITYPTQDFQLTSNSVPVSGTATDDLSGVKLVSIAGPDVIAPTPPQVTPTGAAWSIPVTIRPLQGPTDNGQRTLFVQAVDNAGNALPQPATLTIYLEAPFQVKLDPNDSLSTLAYLRDLIGFSTGDPNGRLQAGSRKVQPQDLERYFCQPFTLLTSDEQVHQVRLSIEILRRYLAGPADPVGYWKFDEGSGSAAADSSGNALTGTLNNTAWGPGKIGGALQFNGNNSYVQIGNPPPLTMSAAVSMAAWILPTGPGLSAQNIIVSKEAQYEMGRYPDGSIGWAFANTSPGWNWIKTNAVAPLNQWTHITVTYDGAFATTYVNGKRVDQRAATGPIGSADPTNNDFRIGGRQVGSQFFQGSVDEVQVFSRALSADEIAMLATRGISNPQLDAAEASYRLLAYKTLLLQLGTSYDELRLARAADSPVRTALANRLGIDLGTSRPDKLDHLVLPPAGIAEAVLERMFGLEATAGNPLSAPQSGTLMAAWQQQHLWQLWTQEDYPADADPKFPTPLIDPDLFMEGDFVPDSSLRDDPHSSAGLNPPHDLWAARRAWVDGQLQSLANDRQAGETDQARLARLIAAQLAPLAITDLLNFNTAYNQGSGIDAKLSAIPLTFGAFSYLIQLYSLASIPGQTLLDDEWRAVYAILIEARKQGQFAAWVAQERQALAPGPILLSPVYFQLNHNGFVAAPWLATDDARRTWQDTLAARIDQQNGLRQSLQAAVSATEEIALPALREALIAAITAVPLPVWSLYSTGVDSGKVTLSDRSVDPHWIITAVPPPGTPGNGAAYATASMPSSWLANTPNSRWISPQADESGGDAPGPFNYKTTFDLSGFDPSTVQVSVNFAVDNDLTAVRLNGRDLGKTGTGFGAFSQFVISGGFIDGINTLELFTANTGNATNPSGLRVEFSSTGFISRQWLTERLVIDVESGGAIQTTRVSQALETIQSILFSVRTGRFGPPGSLSNLSGWQIATSNPDFDADWAWMGSYETWRAAMEVFLYPENVLAPDLRAQMTSAFYTDDPNTPGLVQRVQSAMPITRAQAIKEARTYLGDLKKQNITLPAELIAPGFDITDVDSIAWGALQDPSSGGAFAGYVDLVPAPPHPRPGTTLPAYIAEIYFFVPLYLARQLHQSGEFEAALDLFRLVYAYPLPANHRKVYYGLILEEAIQTTYERAFNWVRDLDPHDFIAPTRKNAYTQFTILSLVECCLDFGDSEFTRDTEESRSLARTLYLTALDLLDAPELRPQTTEYQPNPIPGTIRDRANASLQKLRNNLNIAGLQRPASGAIGSGTALALGPGGLLGLPSPSTPLPTAYRYSTLIDRAKQLVQLAQQVENSYLAALQRIDVENYDLLKAIQDLELAGANLDLQALKVNDANDGVTLAVAQKTRAQTQFDTYDSWINAGRLQSETDMIQQYSKANDARNAVAGLSAAVTTAQAITTAASSVLGGVFSGFGGFMSAAAVGTLAAAQASAQVLANNAESQAQIDSANASFERLQQQWQLQRSLAQNDLAIGQAQIQLANDQVGIANKEQQIAQIQDAHEQAIVKFLATQFTNVQLYQWMSGVLGGVYRYFLQQATAVAQLAQNQLIFERQQGGVSFIKADYWQLTSSSTALPSATGSSQGIQTGGLTGSARLLQDITQLDQYAFLTDTRKLQITKVISLAQLFPLEFQQFRQTGILQFSTPSALFDRDFPGQYLRLVKRVQVSVVALIPPNQGVKATLANSGISRVVAGGDTFSTVTITRYPELVALSSPINATGLFALDAQPELLLPFEGTGADTSWEFRMPKAANLFDFSTIADILLSLDYTALDSSLYRQLVVKQLDRNISLDRAFSFSQDFPDQWYDLNNPDQLSVPFSVGFSLTPTDFPPNIDRVTIQNVLLYLVHADNQVCEIKGVNLAVGATGGAADTIGGIISIRRGNASAWIPMQGKSPVGDWTLALPDVPDTSSGLGTRTLFQKGIIQDILFVITYKGLTPAWPNAAG
jgi:hypothetical protein